MSKRRGHSNRHRIDRSGQRGIYKARPHPLFVLLMAAVAGGLVYLGIIIYPPIYSAIMNWSQREPAESLPVPDESPPPEPGPGDEHTEPEPALPPRRPGGALRAVYAPPALVADSGAFGDFLDGLPGAGLNAVMIDIKDRQGQLLYSSLNQSAAAWGVIAEDAFDLAALASRLRESGLHLIVRMSAFRDERAARANIDNAVRARGTEMHWLDNVPGTGQPWLNPHSQGARQYIADIAVEAVRLGAVMVVLDDFQFPPNSMMEIANFGDTDGMTRAQRLGEFASELCETLTGQGGRLAIYMPAVAIASEANMTFFGGAAEDILSEYTVLGALPYQFPASGFTGEVFSIGAPHESLNYTLERIIGYIGGRVDSQIIALIQGGSLPGGARHTGEQIRAQVDLLERLGVSEFIFYAPYAGHYQIKQ